MKKIRVLVVEDSAVVRELLCHIIRQDPRLEVAAAVPCAEEALRVLHRVKPDVISMDIRLPGMNGFEATERIMAERPTPIVVVSASVESEDLHITMNALRAGALSVVEKPLGSTHQDYQILAESLCTRLAIMSEVKVIRRRRPASRPLDPMAKTAPPGQRSPGTYRALGVVTSTGGPSAVAKLLAGFRIDFPLPILLVQHITASFLKGYVDWLNSVSPLPAVIARNGELPVGGQIYVAPAEGHLRIRSRRLHIEGGDPVCGQIPSGTVLLESMARDLGAQAIGVVLTGMGEDGASGLLAIHRAGGYTIVEDQTTAVVFGMPAAALQLGGVSESLPLDSIISRICELAPTGQEVR